MALALHLLVYENVDIHPHWGGGGRSVVLTAQVISFCELTETDRQRWHTWQAGRVDLASPFFRFEFAQIASRHSPGARVARLRRDGQLVGYFPFQWRGGAVYPIAAPMNDYHGVIGPQAVCPSLEEVADALAAKRMVVNGWVGPADAGRKLESYQAALPVGGYDAWLADRLQKHAKYFKDKARARRSMEAELGEVEVRTGLHCPELLDQLIALKRAQYRRTGRHDIFGAAWTRELLSALLGTTQDGFGASIATLQAGGQLLAIEYSLHADGRYHFWFPVYLVAGARFSPGILLSMETMQQEQARGHSVFDYGFGGETYKKYFVNSAQSVTETALHRFGLMSATSRVCGRGLDRLAPRRAVALRTSIERRWAAIEATEVTRTGRAKGAVLAARRAMSRLSVGES